MNILKKINAVAYKFIWNRHYLAAKAPERIKRDIVTNSISNGGYGMLDVSELDGSLKIKALSRMLNSNHPFLEILRNKLDLHSYFNPTSTVPGGIDPVMDRGIDLLKADRQRLWGNSTLDGDRNLLASIRELNLRHIVDRRGQGSINFFRLWARGARYVRDLRVQDLEGIRRHVVPHTLAKLRKAVAINTGPPNPNFIKTYFTGSQHRPLESLTAKEIRNYRSDKTVIVNFKLGIHLTAQEGQNWGQRLRKLTSSRHKNSLLKALHGDVYTRAKLHRFGLIDTDTCSKCGGTEDLRHKVLECPYSSRLWDSVLPTIRRLNTLNDPNESRLKLITGTSLHTSLASMTLIAEIIQTILHLRHEQSYLLHPKYLAKRAIKNLSIKEGNLKIRRCFIESHGDELR